jgi:hypothetical protein
VLLALAGLLASRRAGPLALASAAPYVRYHLRGYEHAPRGLVRAAFDLPGRVLVDLAGVAATARAAIRHGAAVL